MAFFHKLPLFRMCYIALFLLVTLQIRHVSAAKPRSERGSPFILATYARTRGAVPELTSAYKHETNQLQTTSVRRPPSGPNPEGNFEVNALSKDASKHGTKVQDIERSGTVSMTKNDLPASTQGQV
jgi:hypothetical protein